MEQDRGKQQQQQKVSFGQRWRETRPTKAVLFWACVACIVLTMLIGFRWGGWVTGGTAQSMAKEMADDAVINRLAPICVANFNQDPGKEQKFNELKAASSWDRSTYIEKQGWATISGEEQPTRGVAAECAILLMQAPAPSVEKTSLLK